MSATLPHDLSVAEQLAYCTVRIETTYPNGDSGTGTGFFYTIVLEDGSHIPLIVTNRHVVKGTASGRFLLTLERPAGGPDFTRHEKFEFSNFQGFWVDHPDPNIDLVAMPIAHLYRFAAGKNWRVFLLPVFPKLLPSAEDIADLVGMEEITMVGYPNGLWDKVNNHPVFRRGILASNYKLDWNGKSEFLIDAACFPGSSGSPVFLFNPSGYHSRKGTRIG